MMPRPLVCGLALSVLGAASVLAEPQEAPSLPVLAAVELRGTSDPSLSRYLTLKAGDLLDPETVRSTVLLLAGMDLFDEITAVREDTAGGARLVFRVRETPRLGALRFVTRTQSGADVPLDPELANDLKRASGLRAGEPFRDQTLEEANARLMEWLRAHAYPSAALTIERAATPEPQGEPPATRDLIVRVEDPVQERLVSYRLDGWPAALPKRQLPTKLGEPLTLENLEEWKGDILRILRKATYYRAQVRTESVRGDLVFFVNPGTPYETRFDILDAKESAKAREHFTEEGLSQDAIEETMSAIESRYVALGHRDVEVDFQETKASDRTVGAFVARPGPAWTIAVVEYKTNGQPSPNPGVMTPGMPWLDADVEAEKNRLRADLVQQGYASAAVSHEESGDPVNAKLGFNIIPGPLTTVSAVALEGAPPPTERGNDSVVELVTREKQPFRAADVARDRSTLLGSLRDDGYVDARIDALTDFADDRTTVAVTFKVSPGPRVRVGRIIVVGLKDTRETVVLRESRLLEGDFLSYQKLLDTQSGLSSTGLFTNVQVRELTTDSDVRNLVIEVTEGSRTTIVPGIGVSEREKLRASLELTKLNISGLGRTASLFLRGSTLGSSRVLLSVTEPYAFGRKQAVNVQIYRDDDRSRLTFDSLRYGFQTQTIFPFRHANILTRYTFQKTFTSNVEQDCAEVNRDLCEGRISGPSIGFIHDTRSDALDPRRGSLYSIETLLSMQRLGGDSFIKGTAFAARYEEVRAGTVIAGSIRVGLSRAFGDSIELPLPERFFAGGASLMRGFKLDELGPGRFTSDQFVPEGGNALVAAALEARIDFTKRFGIQIFAEIGNVYSRVKAIDLKDLREVAGIGIHYKSPFGPLRLDWGFKLDRRSEEKRQQLHLGVGYAF